MNKQIALALALIAVTTQPAHAGLLNKIANFAKSPADSVNKKLHLKKAYYGPITDAPKTRFKIAKTVLGYTCLVGGITIALPIAVPFVIGNVLIGEGQALLYTTDDDY